MSITQKVKWDSYAPTYDLLLAYNPYYQHLFQAVISATRSWQIPEGGKIADLGAGTGNYSISLARNFPHAQIFHIDSDSGMNTVAQQKRGNLSLLNHHICEESIDTLDLADESLDALISIHALYTFPDTNQALYKIHQWLKPGGEVILVDPGRIVNVLSWQIAIAYHMIRSLGLKKTFQIFRKGKEVSKQNALIRKMQLNGTYWTHSHEEFCTAVENAGFEVLEAGTTFRGVSDWVKARKRQ